MTLPYTPQQMLARARVLLQRGDVLKARYAMTLMKRLNIIEKKERGETIVIYIVASSDDEKDEYMKFLWGDYWVQYELIKGFGADGEYRISKINPDILIHLFGHPRKLPQQTYNIVWIYSHPDVIQQAEYLHQYDWIYVLSESYKRIVQQMGREAEVMVGATSKTPFPGVSPQYPAVFVGNSRRGIESRPVVECLTQCTYPFKVWGNGWEQYLPQENIGGRYFDYLHLDRLYACSDFSLNDHHPDMQKFGFVAVKIFDILASGGFAISDRNSGIEDIFGGSVPQFSNAQELQEIFDRYAPGKPEREYLRKKGREIALNNTWQDRTKDFIRRLQTEFDPASTTHEIESVLKDNPSTTG